MLLNYEDYKDKLRGCWLGKNIGGTLGAPFEGKRQINNVDFYIQDLKGEPPANDDLDLQLVWLNAVEKYGSNVNASILGEYWLSFVLPDWVEYGAGKNNLKMGLVPPLSGYVENPYRDSCGCFIRSEIWACLAPGNPELAARYAYEDAMVDHSTEGAYGEVFCAAIQSSAFVETDRFSLIDIGLSYIPEDCGVARGIKTAIESYKAGVHYTQARRNVLTAVPGAFGNAHNPRDEEDKDIPVGDIGWDAPSNVALMVVGLLYGEGDFGKSICIAVNCGEDTDCTAATLGALLGIAYGAKNIPQKWVEPLGDKINTICINNSNFAISIPKTVTELTERILRIAPIFLGSYRCDILSETDRYTILMEEPENLVCRNNKQFGNGMKNAQFVVNYRFATFDAVLDYMGEPYIRVNEVRKFKLLLSDNNALGAIGWGQQQWLTVKCWVSEGIQVLKGREISVFLPYLRGRNAEVEIEIFAESLNTGKIEMLIDITSNGRHTRGVIPVVLLAR